MNATDLAAYTALVVSVGATVVSVGAMIIQVIKATQDARITVLENTVSSLHQRLANETSARQASDTAKDSIIASLQDRIEELVLEIAMLKTALAVKTAEVENKGVESGV